MSELFSPIGHEHHEDALRADITRMGEQTLQHVRADRRTVLRDAALTILAAYAPGFRLMDVAEGIGADLDRRDSPENVIGQTVPVLEARRSNQPVVEPLPRSYDTAEITTLFSKDSLVMRLDWDKPLEAEHTGTAIDSDPLFAAGEGVITTAEGLKLGKQEYCTFFRNEKQIIAVGFEGGLYVYEPRLGGQGEHESRGEWVRIITKDPKQPLPLRAVAHDAWQYIQDNRPESMLAKRVVVGTQTLNDIGYKAYGAVLPSTRMPEMKAFELGPHNCAQNVGEILDGSKELAISQFGKVMDYGHILAKAGETVTSVARMVYEIIDKTSDAKAANAKTITLDVPYAKGYSAEYTYSINLDSLQSDDDIYDMVFAVMNDVGMQMEGVSQSYIEKMPGGQKFAHVGNFDPGDLSSNTEAVLRTIKKMKADGFIGNMRGRMQSLHQKTKKLPHQKKLEAISKEVADIKTSIAVQVRRDAARAHGVRKQETAQTYTLPLELYHFIPTVVRETDAATPTFIDWRDAGVTLNNPRMEFKAIKIPAWEAIAGRIAVEARRKTKSLFRR